MSEEFEQKRREFHELLLRVEKLRGVEEFQRVIDFCVRYGLTLEEKIVVLRAEAER